MATAPRPGIGAQMQAEVDESLILDSGMKIHCEAENKTVTVLMGDITSTAELAVIQRTGMQPAEILAKTQTHTSVLVWYWLGMQGTNDVRTLQQILDRYGSARLYSEAGFEIEGIGSFFDEEEDDPEGPSQPDELSGSTGPTGPASTDSTPGTSADPQS